MPGTLFIVATPIGNLGDITLRALEILKSADFILCEDTRVTQKLLNHYDIKTPVLRYNERDNIRRFVEMLNRGKNLALVSDAGTPGISDPGGKLVKIIAGAAPRSGGGPRVVPIPGPSALTAAASISGFAMDKFLFLGFPPVKKRRRKFFEQAANSKHPVILYESPHRILRTLRDLSEIIPESPAVVCRELTKKFETIYRGKVAEISNQMQNKETRGEFVIIIDSHKK